MHKRIIAYLLSIVLMLAGLPAITFAGNDYSSNDDEIYYIDDYEDNNLVLHVDANYDSDWTGDRMEGISWSSSNENVLRISKVSTNGAADYCTIFITIENVGTATISATNNSGDMVYSKKYVIKQNILDIKTPDTIEMAKNCYKEFPTKYSGFDFYGCAAISSKISNGKVYIKGNTEGIYEVKLQKVGTGHKVPIIIKINKAEDFSIPSSEKLMLGKSEIIPVNGSVDYGEAESVNNAGSQLQWKSSDISVVSVNKGEITAKGVGKVTITASFNDEYSHTCEVTVTKKTIGLELIAPKKINIRVGEAEWFSDLGIYVKINGEKVDLASEFDDGIFELYTDSNLIDVGDDCLYGEKKGKGKVELTCEYTDNETKQVETISKTFKVTCKYCKELRVDSIIYNVGNYSVNFRLKNCTAKTIKVYGGGMVVNRTMSGYNIGKISTRAMLLSNNKKSKTIKAGKEKNIKFKTVYSILDPYTISTCIYFKIKWTGKKYTVGAYMDSIAAKGKKWRCIDTNGGSIGTIRKFWSYTK